MPDFTIERRKRILAIDTTNLLYKAFYANHDADIDTIKNLSVHMLLHNIYNYYKKIKPDQIALAFDRPNWRLDYTKSPTALTKKLYKGHRRKSMTPAQKEKYKVFMEHVVSLEENLKEFTTLLCLSADKLEADDLISGVCQLFDDYDVYIISADRDFLQLLRFDTVHLIHPGNDNEVNLKEWHNDADFFMFEKCIRGDSGDNVMSSYPFYKKKNMLDDFNDPYRKANMMAHEFTDANGNAFKTKEIFRENELLMDLTKQPTEIKIKIFQTVNDEIDRERKFNMIKFLKLCKLYDLENIKTKKEAFMKMLSLRLKF